MAATRLAPPGSHHPPRLEGALDRCDAAIADSKAVHPVGTTVFESADGGHSILINSATQHEDIVVLGCLFNELGTPQAIVAEMDSTTAMMGRQEAEADGINYAWSYHPDNGIDMVLTDS